MPLQNGGSSGSPAFATPLPATSELVALNRRIVSGTVSVLIAGRAPIWLMSGLSPHTWRYFFIWMAIGLIIYFGYSMRTSALARQAG